MPFCKFVKARAEDGLADVLGVLDDLLLLHDVDRRDCCSTGKWMTGVRESTGIELVLEVVRQLLAHADTAERDVAGVHAFREADYVGFDVVVLVGEPLTGAAEASHHFVGDVHDVVVTAEFLQTFEIAGRRRDDAGGTDHALDDDRGDRARTLVHDDVLEVLQCTFTLLLDRLRVEVGAVQVWAHEVHDRVGILIRPPTRFAGEIDREAGVAVVRAICGEDLVLAGLHARNTNRVLDCFRTPDGEEHFLVIRGREVADALGSLSACSVRMRRCDGCQHGHLILDRLHDLGVLVPDVRVHQLRREVEEPIAIGIPQMHALGAFDE